MKKIIRKIKKIFTIFGGFLISLYSKVSAVDPSMINENFTVSLYGPPRDTPYIIATIWGFIEIILIPLVFIIGVVVYIKKSSSSVLRKVITILIILAIVVLICFGINYIINNILA